MLKTISCVLAKSVGSELKAHSGLRRMETWKSLRTISDKASVFDTLSAQIWLWLSSSSPREGEVFLGIEFKRAACSNREIDAQAISGFSLESAPIVDEVAVQVVPLTLLQFFSFSPVPLIQG